MSDASPEGWKFVPLSNLARVVSGGTPSRDVNSYWGGDIPWVTPTDITRTNGRYLLGTQENITRLGLSSSSATLLPPSAILMTSRATVGESRIAGMEVCTNQGFKSLVPQKGVNGLFLYYQMQRLRGAYKVFGIGSTFLEVSKKDTERFSVLMPANEGEQKAIAAVIDSVDVAIEKTEALIAKYQQIKAGLMHDLFTRGVTADGKLRPPREQAPELYQETPIGWIPKEWRFGVLDSFSDIHNNLRKPISAEIRETMQGEYPYYGPTGVLDYINEFLVEGEYCLIGEDGDHFLKFADWSMTLLVRGRFNVNNHAHILSGRNGAATRWLHAFFLNRDITFHLTRQGAGRFKLNKAALKALPIYVPEPAEQEEILDRLEAAHSLVEAQFKQLEKLRQQKLGLMSDLLTGKVRVAV